MTNADLSSEPTPGAHAPLAQALAALVAFLQALAAQFACVFAALRAERAEAIARRRNDFLDHYPALREAEFAVRATIAGGAGLILAGQPLETTPMRVADLTDDWVCPVPRSAADMQRRVEAVARIMAEPLRYMTRLAQRIAAAARPQPPEHAERTLAPAPEASAPRPCPRSRAPPCFQEWTQHALQVPPARSRAFAGT